LSGLLIAVTELWPWD